jgi:hypothetical protein
MRWGKVYPFKMYFTVRLLKVKLLTTFLMQYFCSATKFYQLQIICSKCPHIINLISSYGNRQVKTFYYRHYYTHYWSVYFNEKVLQRWPRGWKNPTVQCCGSGMIIFRIRIRLFRWFRTLHEFFPLYSRLVSTLCKTRYMLFRQKILFLKELIFVTWAFCWEIVKFYQFYQLSGSGSCKKFRIRPDPDPQQCFNLHARHEMPKHFTCKKKFQLFPTSIPPLFF